MASETLLKFADDLRSARESKGISIQQIANRTKIDPKFLNAIENANFEILPEIYVRAFIKEFAQTLDLNPIEIIHKYEQAKAGIVEKLVLKENQLIVETKVEEVVQKVETVEEEKTDPKTSEQAVVQDAVVENQQTQIVKEEEKPVEQSKQIEINQAVVGKEFGSNTSEIVPQQEETISFVQSNLNLILGSVVLILAAIVFYFAIIHESSPEIVADTQEEKNITNTERFEVPQTKQQTVEDSLQNPSTTEQAVDDSLKLSVENSEQVWIKVLTDGKVVQQGVVKKGTTANYKAMKQFGVSIGNAGVVKMFYNGKPVSNIGKVGEIRNITITPDTIRYLTIKRNEKKPSASN